MFLEVEDAWNSRTNEERSECNKRRKNRSPREQQNEQKKTSGSTTNTNLLFRQAITFPKSKKSSSQKTVMETTTKVIFIMFKNVFFLSTSSGARPKLKKSNNLMSNSQLMLVILVIFSYFLATVHGTFLSQPSENANNLLSHNKKINNKLSSQQLLRIRNFTKLPPSIPTTTTTTTTTTTPDVSSQLDDDDNDVSLSSLDLDDEEQSGEETFEATTRSSVRAEESALIEIFKMRLLKLLEIEQAPTPSEINLNENPIPEPILRELVHRAQIEQEDNRRRRSNKGKRSMLLNENQQASASPPKMISNELDRVIETIVDDQVELEKETVRFNGSVVQQVTLLPKKCFCFFFVSLIYIRLAYKH